MITVRVYVWDLLKNIILNLSEMNFTSNVKIIPEMNFTSNVKIIPEMNLIMRRMIVGEFKIYLASKNSISKRWFILYVSKRGL